MPYLFCLNIAIVSLFRVFYCPTCLLLSLVAGNQATIRVSIASVKALDGRHDESCGTMQNYITMYFKIAIKRSRDVIILLVRKDYTLP
jgi:hypothetical protein